MFNISSFTSLLSQKPKKDIPDDWQENGRFKKKKYWTNPDQTLYIQVIQLPPKELSKRCGRGAGECHNYVKGTDIHELYVPSIKGTPDLNVVRKIQVIQWSVADIRKLYNSMMHYYFEPTTSTHIIHCPRLVLDYDFENQTRLGKMVHLAALNGNLTLETKAQKNRSIKLALMEFQNVLGHSMHHALGMSH